MARLPYVKREMLSDKTAAIYDRIAETRGSVEPDTPMPNSFRVLLNNPAAAAAVGQLGEYLRFSSSLDPTVREIAILSVAKHTGSEYEWLHHEPVARAVGVRPAVIDAIQSGRAPMGLPAKERHICPGCQRACESGRPHGPYFPGCRTPPGTCWSRRLRHTRRLLRHARDCPAGARRRSRRRAEHRLTGFQ